MIQSTREGNSRMQMKRSVYSLKQDLRQQSKKFDNFKCDLGYCKSEKYHCYYFKHFDNSYMILLLYVDDMLIVLSSIEKISNLKQLSR